MFASNAPDHRRKRYAENEEVRLARKASNAKWRAANRDKLNAARRERYANDPDFRATRREQGNKVSKDAIRKYCLKAKYGLSVEDHQRMMEHQDNACAICREPFRKTAHVDHCHKTKAVRSLLCGTCNVGLGAFGDCAARLRAAAEYLEKFHGSR